ncbi:YaaA family protein [Kineococcus indalonis]|uniref:YaaA family protein n=1 Tax=Kineococcus indalonis TaxID=2696566 RepID=UPI001411E5B5|nr:peroxide stress protein YaaA [Kineococcus indalonis]NAZ85088.1 peroxide stress protein YaaA [Kineococcus indalonis]
MLVLLPPSESKWAGPARGAPVDLGALHRPELSAAREQVLDALVAVSARPDAPALLGAGAGLAEVVRANTTLRTRPAAPAARVYTGVLHDALDLPSLPAAAARRVLVVSALWGVLGPRDRVPGYRLSMGTDLPGVGPLAAFWRPHLAAVLQPSGLVVDCRSAAYAAAWVPDAATAARTVAVRVLRDGRVVSHAAKHTRGLLARHLLTRTGRPPRTPAALLDAAVEAFGAKLLEPVRRGAPWTLEVEAP